MHTENKMRVNYLVYNLKKLAHKMRHSAEDLLKYTALAKHVIKHGEQKEIS